MITITNIMSTNLHTLTPQDTLAKAAKLMADKQIRHIPILDDAELLVGLISERDLIAAKQSSLLKQANHQAGWEEVAVAEIMTKVLTTVDPKASVKAAALYLQKHKFGCLPVVKKGKLLGIITDTDFVTVAITLLELDELNEADEIDELDELDDL